MRKRRSTKLIHEGRYVAEVDIDLLDTKEGWSPYLSLEDAMKLDDVRSALRRGDLENADSTKGSCLETRRARAANSPGGYNLFVLPFSEI